MTQLLTDLVKHSEGFRANAYPDPGSGGDPWTIGYGSTIFNGRAVKPGMSVTEAQATAQLSQDLARFRSNVATLAGAGTDAQLDAMTSLAYNIGLANFAKSTVLAKHKLKDYKGAAAAFALWNKASGKVLPGLVTRRANEAYLYIAGKNNF